MWYMNLSCDYVFKFLKQENILFFLFEIKLFIKEYMVHEPLIFCKVS